MKFSLSDSSGCLYLPLYTNNEGILPPSLHIAHLPAPPYRVPAPTELVYGASNELVSSQRAAALSSLPAALEDTVHRALESAPPTRSAHAKGGAFTPTHALSKIPVARETCRVRLPHCRARRALPPIPFVSLTSHRALCLAPYLSSIPSIFDGILRALAWQELVACMATVTRTRSQSPEEPLNMHERSVSGHCQIPACS